MHLEGWEFVVLSPIFSVHWGILTKKSRPSWRERQNSNNRRKFQHFKKEIFARYNKDYTKKEDEEMKLFEETAVKYPAKGYKMRLNHKQRQSKSASSQ